VPRLVIADDHCMVAEGIERILVDDFELLEVASDGDALLEGIRRLKPDIVISDISMPGRSGLDFQRELSAANIHVPIIFITGYGDIPMSVQAIKEGAIEFLTKPFRDQDLLDAIQLGLARDRTWLENEKAIATLRARFETFTPASVR